MSNASDEISTIIREVSHYKIVRTLQPIVMAAAVAALILLIACVASDGVRVWTFDMLAAAGQKLNTLKSYIPKCH